MGHQHPRGTVLRCHALPTLLAGFVLACMCGGDCGSARGAAAAAGELPRYGLRVGQELRFAMSDVSTLDDGGQHLSGADFTAWVVAANADGSWQMVANERSRFATVDAEGKRNDSRERVQLETFALFPDGRVVAPPLLALRMNPAQYFPRLPDGPEQLAGGWSSDDPARGGQTASRPLPDEARDGRFAFEAVSQSPWNEMYLMTWRITYGFDAARGVVADGTIRSSQGWGFKSTGEGRIELKAVEQRDAAWVERFATETATYFAARDRYQQITNELPADEKAAKARLAEAEGVLKAARDAVQTPAVQAHLDHEVEEHARLGDYLVEKAQFRAELIDRPSPKWAAIDLDGQMHAFKRYRGKILVLDFWYRGCGWCIRAMPAVKRVAERTRDKPVVVFGMNTDRDVNDAKFVVEKMGLPYVNLKARDIVGPYRVSAFPTLIIVDQQGIVRDIHVGYSPTLEDEVMTTIDKLLAEGEKTAEAAR
jgi:thiol-disulfide isomerase/thioredoxin